MRKVEQSGRGTIESSLEGDWMPAGGLILDALTHTVDEKRHVFSGQQLLALWRKSLFSCLMLGCFTIKAP